MKERNSKTKRRTKETEKGEKEKTKTVVSNWSFAKALRIFGRPY